MNELNSMNSETSIEDEVVKQNISSKINIKSRALIAVVTLIIVLGIAVIAALIYLDYQSQWISTNNAHLEGRIFSISVPFSGKIEKLSIRENIFVEQGTLLASLDSAIQKLQIMKILIAKKENALAIQKLKYLPGSAFDYELARVRREELRLQLEEAQLLYNKTKIISPASGYVAQLQVEEGEYVVPGQTIMSIVNLEELWITANFTEQEIRYVKVGQDVYIHLDAYPDKTLTGKVESIMPAGGAAFALFPPDATAGTWVRVAQRIPVKIIFNHIPETADLLLRIGMLASVRVEK